MVFHLDFWFERYHRLKQHMSTKTMRAHPLSFDIHFIIPWTTTKQVCYMGGKVSSRSQMGLDGIQFHHLHQKL